METKTERREFLKLGTAGAAGSDSFVTNRLITVAVASQSGQ
jgi:hypothetical protein